MSIGQPLPDESHYWIEVKVALTPHRCRCRSEVRRICPRRWHTGADLPHLRSRQKGPGRPVAHWTWRTSPTAAVGQTGLMAVRIWPQQCWQIPWWSWGSWPDWGCSGTAKSISPPARHFHSTYCRRAQQPPWAGRLTMRRYSGDRMPVSPDWPKSFAAQPDSTDTAERWERIGLVVLWGWANCHTAAGRLLGWRLIWTGTAGGTSSSCRGRGGRLMSADWAVRKRKRLGTALSLSAESPRRCFDR